MNADEETKKLQEKELAKNKKKAVSTLLVLLITLLCRRKSICWSPERVHPITEELLTLVPAVELRKVTFTTWQRKDPATTSSGRL